MKKRQLLIGTSNKGKLSEIKSFLSTSMFDIVTLDDLKINIEDPEETGTTLEDNAILKARYYGEKTGLLTLADDGGIYIDALDGWPGIKSARSFEGNDVTKDAAMMEELASVPTEERTAVFRTCLALYDPQSGQLTTSHGELRGEIHTDKMDAGDIAWGYNKIFYVRDLDKTYAEMNLAEKNGISHRGKALQRMKYHFDNTYKAKDLVVPFSLIIEDGKVLMILRNDPHRPEYHNKWEFPGGGVEKGESMHSNVIRETAEEAGYEVEVIKLLQYISVELQTYPTFEYQIYLVPYVCKVKQKLENVQNDEEVLDVQWFELDDVLNHDLIGENARMYKELLPELKEVAQAHSL